MKFKFKKYGEYARAGTININGRELETPHLFPVMCFYCGGLEGAKFGGGIYRNIKEEFLPRKDFSNIFQGVMTSISHLADFHVTKKKLENIYLAKTIHEWFDFDGVLFVDSGGFKLFKNGAIKCTDFEIKPDPKEILNLQEKFGGDIIATLDYPIHPELPKKEKEKRIKLSIKNGVYALNKRPRKTAVYLAVHGHSYDELEDYFSKVFEEMESNNISHGFFNGVAIGSLVPIKNNYEMIIDIVKACKQILDNNGYKKMPLHVFGISSSLMPILAYLGVDSFDSASFLYAALNGRYFLDDFRRIHIDNVDFKECNCAICKDERYIKKMKNAKIRVKDRVSPIAIHNLIKHHTELEKIRTLIREDISEVWTYILDRSKNNKRLNKAITKVL